MTDRATQTNRIVFYSQGQTAIMNADGSGLRYFEFYVHFEVAFLGGFSNSTFHF